MKDKVCNRENELDIVVDTPINLTKHSSINLTKIHGYSDLDFISKVEVRERNIFNLIISMLIGLIIFVCGLGLVSTGYGGLFHNDTVRTSDSFVGEEIVDSGASEIIEKLSLGALVIGAVVSSVGSGVMAKNIACIIAINKRQVLEADEEQD